ncbi:OsmC family protein [Nocardioides sp. P86]|uniref:OsmC family protein n=1 Tax=Nocardioides sp. P86 TaxID=2939569 RepID=UPI00204057A0|nr:OsmC family protein [Nocardioides sp. P86]MCM3516547.1 OsmC family protein [Nocardioides sp. P86]
MTALPTGPSPQPSTGPSDLRAQVRAAQAPLKQRYRDDPASARTPLRARAGFADPGVTATVDTWAGPARAGLHEATGGDGSDACSGDMLLEALLACAGVTLRSVALASGVDVLAATGTAEAVFDARGTLGVDREAPVGVTDVVVTFDLTLPEDSTVDEEQLARLAATTERYCVVGQSLREPPRVVVRRA